ncbi:SurA N-terminal domain-containing protein [Candidatus Microgenomates bacterium]|nr:SurA N-terminal domain-containing protein [Candidatus Microgenomates bacterium]
MPRKVRQPIPAEIRGMFFSGKLARYLAIAIIVVVAALLAWNNKSLFVVATVNGQIVPRWSLETKLIDRYGKDTLEEVVNEQIILQAGAKKGITVSDKEVADKSSEVEKSLGGKITLSDALASQGMTVAEFQSQIRLQLTLEKLAGASIVVSDQDVTDYIASNSATMTATDEAGLRDEAKTAILNQKKSTALRQLFTDLKSQAKVARFL